MSHRSQTISVVVVIRNHAARLEATLQSLGWADELLVVDRGSTDDTLAIARRFTSKVFFHPGRLPSDVLNGAFELASQDWILYVEPGEQVQDMLRHAIDGALLNPSAALTAFRLAGQDVYRGQPLPGPLRDCGIRLFRKGQARAEDDLDPRLITEGEVRRLDRPLRRDVYPTLQAMFDEAGTRSTVAAYRRLDADGHGPANTSLLSLYAASKWAGFRHFFLYGGLWDGQAGFAAAMARTLETFLTHAKMRGLTAGR